MQLLFLLVVAGAALVGARWALPRLLTRRRQFRTLAKGLRRMRDLAGQPVTYRSVSPRDQPLGPAQKQFDAAAQELHANGCALLGDFVEVDSDGAAGGLTRWFADPSRTVCGWFGVTQPSLGPGSPVMTLFSETQAGEFFITARGAATTTLAQPPTLHRVCCTWGSGLAGALQFHHEQLRSAGVSEPVLRTIHTSDDALALSERVRGAVARWREAQPPGQLLEQDLQAVLQDRYGKLGPRLRDLLDAEER